MSSATRCERTLAREARVAGVSFLSGHAVTTRFLPAEPGTGIVFVRTDLPGHPEVPARAEYVVPQPRRTVVRNGPAVVEMIEHVMAALAGLRIDNVRVAIDGPETPGCDGSSLAFVEALDAAGAVEQDRVRAVLQIDQPVELRDQSAVIAAEPGWRDQLELAYDLDYGDSPIGRQSRSATITPATFRTELAASRTFLLLAEAEALRAAGMGLHATGADLLVFGPEGPIDNQLRFPDECVRHKLLDLVGDLALLGMDLVGRVHARRSGHHLNAALVRRLAAGGGVAAPSSRNGKNGK